MRRSEEQVRGSCGATERRPRRAKGGGESSRLQYPIEEGSGAAFGCAQDKEVREAARKPVCGARL